MVPPDANEQPEERMKNFEGPVTIEKAFKVDGKRLVVRVTFPAAVAQDVGMEALTIAASRAIVAVDSNSHRVEKLR